MAHFSSRTFSRPAGFTLMEIMVVVTIIMVLTAIAVPAISSVRAKANQVVALNTLRQLTAALLNYQGQNDGAFPAEDAKGQDGWSAAAQAGNENIWYNVLPRQLGKKGVADFANEPRGFYTRENLLFLPGAEYPPTDHKLTKPLFAVAINTKLQRKDSSGGKPLARVGAISNPARTVAFLEQGLPTEKKAMAQQPKYDGSCKGSAKSFVARAGGRGVLSFLDGHAEVVAADKILTDSGQIPFPPTDIIWTRSPEENPNK